MEIWKDAISISDMLFDYADKAEEKKCFRFAEQLRAATMSISNNIAEGSGSFSDKDFASFLNISRRSVFECANILQILLQKIISRRPCLVNSMSLHAPCPRLSCSMPLALPLLPNLNDYGKIPHNPSRRSNNDLPGTDNARNCRFRPLAGIADAQYRHP